MDRLIASNDALDDIDELRSRAARDGYLYLRDFTSRELALQTRRDFVEVLARRGWLDPGTDPMDAISTRPQGTSPAEFASTYLEIQGLESFHSLAHEPVRVELMQRLFGEPVLVHPCSMGRVYFPNSSQHTVPPHQDISHVQGSEETWTGWTPLGQCSETLGGVALVPGSHTIGVLPVHPIIGIGGRGVQTDQLERGFATADFELGDLLFIHTYTVHTGVPNRSSSRIRLSADYRYQKLSDPITVVSLGNHPAVPWEQLYKGWKSQQYQYYWNQLSPTAVAYDPSRKAPIGEQVLEHPLLRGQTPDSPDNTGASHAS